MSSTWFTIALAGAVGTLARYALGHSLREVLGDTFPWGTLIINALGCFLFGVVWSLAEIHALVSDQTRLTLLTGFMGAFTTFSTFGFETAQLIGSGQWSLAVLNIALQNVLGVLFVFAGMVGGRAWGA